MDKEQTTQLDQFDETAHSSGDVLFGDEFDTAMPEHALQTLLRLWHTARDQHGRLYIVLISIIFYTVLTIAAPWYSAGIIDLLWKNIQEARAVGVGFVVTFQQGGREILILFLLYFGAWLFYSLQGYLMVGFAERLSCRLRTALSEKLDRLPLAYFDRKRTGATLSHFTNDLDKVSEAMQYGILKFFTSLGLIIGSVVMMFRFNVLMTLLFLLFTFLSMGVTRLFSAVTLRRAAKRQAAMSRVTSLVEEAYTGRIIVKAYCRDEQSRQEIHAANEALAQAAERTDFVMNAINPAIRLVNRLGQMAIAVAAGWFLITGRLSVGVFQAFFQYVNQAAEPLTEASYIVNSMQSALASAERVYALLDEEEETADAPETALQAEGEARGLVEFRNVAFGYEPDRLLMHSINFTAKPGQKIAIVGTTGAGKTTLINLLMRFYEVNGGGIYLDGVSTAAMSRRQLRKNFGMVLQDTWLFEGSIAENIAYGRPEASREEIIAAAKAARVDFFVRTMPKGYDTHLSDETEQLSAGQRQLLTIARVLLCDPAVLILDEATSSVDTRTEIEIGKAMHQLMRGRTSFVIAHRLSTIVDADLILVMEHGDIVEQGSHETLLQKGGVYAALYNSQFEGGEAGVA